MLPPYTFPTPSIELVQQALSQDSLQVSEERVGVLKRERTRLAAALRDVPQVVHVYPSDANFILVRTRDGQAFRETARRADILVRTFDDPLLADCVRITVGRPTDNDQLLQAVSGAERKACVKCYSSIATGRSSRSARASTDSVEQPLVAGVIPALLRLKTAGYQFVIVTNQPGLGGADQSARPVRAAPTRSCSRCSHRREFVSSATSFARILRRRTARAASRPSASFATS